MELPFSRVLVTGGTGFIGDCLVGHLLRHGCVVKVFSRGVSPALRMAATVELLKGDIRDPIAVRHAVRGSEIVFHLAAWNGASGAGEDAEALWATNVDGTRHVLDAARVAGVRRVVHFSSVKALGETTGERANGSSGATTYGRSRLAAEQLVEEAAHAGALQVCCLRLPLVWGPGHRGNLYRMLAAIDRGRFPPLPSLDNRRSLVHVDDVVQAAMLAAAHPAASGKTYTVTDGGAYSGTELYELLLQALGRKTPRWRVPLPALRALAWLGDALGLVYPRVPFDSSALTKLTASAHYDERRLQEELGYTPAVTVQRGLPAFVDWYREQSRA